MAKSIGIVFQLPGVTNEDIQVYDGDFFKVILCNHVLHHEHGQCWFNGRINDWNFIIEFNQDELKDIPGLEHASHLNALIPFFSITLENLLTQLFTCKLYGALADRYIYARIVDILIELSHLAKEKIKPKFNDELIRKAECVKEIIDADISSYLTVAQLAKKVWLSPSILQQVFQYRYNISVGKYSRQLRLNAAHAMLLNTNDLLLSIALAVGFNDTGNFCTSFKSFFGYTPGELRRNKFKSQ